MPSLPSMGFILASLKLERASRTYHGPNDIIRGSVVLKYQPPDKATMNELFGPLHVDVVLEGQLKAQTYESDEDRHKRNCDCPACFRGVEERILCRKITSLGNGPVRMKEHTTVEYPFVTQFPEYPEEDVYGHGGLERLPPSFDADKLILKSEGFAQATYRITAQVDMPGIDVRVVSRGGPYTVHFVQPGYPSNQVTSPSEHVDSHRVCSKYLLPEARRARGFRALFAKQDELPDFVFSTVISSFPTSLNVDQGIVFEIGVIPDFEASTSTILPEVTLKKCDITFRTIIDIKSCGTDRRGRPFKGFGLKPISLSPQISPEGPFDITKKGLSNTKMISSPPVENVGSTLCLENVQRSYEIQVHIELLVAGQSVIVSLKRQKLTINTPPELARAEGCVNASGSGFSYTDPALPLYESPENQASKTLDQLPPRYDTEESIRMEAKGTVKGHNM